MTVSVGRTVHYRVMHGPHKGECRAAVVVRVSADGAELDVHFSRADGAADSIARRLDVREGTEPGMWHWPEREELKPGDIFVGADGRPDVVQSPPTKPAKRGK